MFYLFFIGLAVINHVLSPAKTALVVDIFIFLIFVLLFILRKWIKKRNNKTPDVRNSSNLMDLEKCQQNGCISEAQPTEEISVDHCFPELNEKFTKLNNVDIDNKEDCDLDGAIDEDMGRGLEGLEEKIETSLYLQRKYIAEKAFPYAQRLSELRDKYTSIKDEFGDPQTHHWRDKMLDFIDQKIGDIPDQLVLKVEKSIEEIEAQKKLHEDIEEVAMVGMLFGQLLARDTTKFLEPALDSGLLLNRIAMEFIDDHHVFRLSKDQVLEIIDAVAKQEKVIKNIEKHYSNSIDKISKEKRFYQELKGIFENIKLNSLSLAPNIPGSKLDNAKEYYFSNQDEKAIALYDSTVFGSAKNGIVFGLKGIYWLSERKTPKFTSWGQLSQNPPKQSAKNDGLILIGDEGFDAKSDSTELISLLMRLAYLFQKYSEVRAVTG